MTDINFDHTVAGKFGEDTDVAFHYGDADLISMVELMFFAYRDFVSDPDEILEEHGFGRAHHRVMHFVGRNPGMRVAEILGILKITKQSFGRVLRELIQKEFVFQREGENDRRQRLLFLTEKGVLLHRQLMAPQLQRFGKALQALGQDGDIEDNIFAKFLQQLVNDGERERVMTLIRRNRNPGQIWNDIAAAYSDR